MNACGEKKSKNTSIKNTFKNENITTTISDSNLKISNTKNDSISPKSINEIDSLIFRKFDYSQENLSTTERAMADAGLVDVLDILPQIKLDLRYTTSNNFVGEILYPDTKRCFLKIETLIKLSKALKILQKKNSSYTFIIYDGARPQSVQYKMYEIAKQKGKTKYVAKPEKGGFEFECHETAVHTSLPAGCAGTFKVRATKSINSGLNKVSKVIGDGGINP